MLYQLSYFRKNKPHQSASSCPHQTFASPIGFKCGKRWIRTTEGVRQQIYSLPHLATLVSSQYFAVGLSLTIQGADGGIRTHDPEITNHVLWPTELHRHFNRLRDAKVGIIFNSANFLKIFFQKISFLQFSSPTPLVQRTVITRLAYCCRKIECKYNYSFPN